MMDFFIQMPAFAKIGLSFFGILLVCRMGLALEWSMISFAVLLTLWSGAGAHGLYLQAVNFIKPESLLLIVVIAMLLLFSELLAKSGRMEKTITALKKLFAHDLLFYSGLPAVVGLLPMPGGALVSAPMVDSVDESKDYNPSLKAGINYWFRHIWEYWWPLYPGVILAITISGLTPGVYFLTMLPLTFFSIAGGYFFTLRKVKTNSEKHERVSVNKKDIMQTLVPVAILVFTAMVGPRFIPESIAAKSLASLIAMFSGLVLAMLFIVQSNLGLLGYSIKTVMSKKSFAMILAVAGIQLFATVLKLPLDAQNQVNLVSLMRNEFKELGIPVIYIIVLLPFIAGLVTGVSFGFVGASFPVVFELIGLHQPTHIIMAVTVFAYTFGYIGMLLSPLHICLIVTNEYFNSKLLATYTYIAAPLAVVLGGALLLSGLYYFLF